MNGKSPLASPTAAPSSEGAASSDNDTPTPTQQQQHAHARRPSLSRPPLQRSSSFVIPASDETSTLDPDLGPGPSVDSDDSATDDLPAAHGTPAIAVDDSATPSPQDEASTPEQIQTQEELDRLKQAIHAKMVLSQQRAKLSSLGAAAPTSPPSLGARRVSPIKEEAADAISPSLEASFCSPLPTSTLTTSTESTESSRTIRGSVPATPAHIPLRTPSYPFPYVPGTPRTWSSSFHQPFTALSPTVSAMNIRETISPYEKQMSSVSTPAASVATFMPPGMNPQGAENPQYPTPNLYDLTLLINSEPGLDAWWAAVTNVMRGWFGAERVTLAVPADATDIENVPWGQKATYNIAGSLGMKTNKAAGLSKGNEANRKDFAGKETKPEHVDSPQQPLELPTRNIRPRLEARHSFGGYERGRNESTGDQKSTGSARPRGPLRTASHHPHALNHPETFVLHPEPRQEIPIHPQRSNLKETTFSDPDFSSVGDEVQAGPYIAVFPVLRALDHEAHALIDNAGINRILERGKLVTLTRDYSSAESSRTTSGHSSKNSNSSAESVTQPSKGQPTQRKPDFRSRAGNPTQLSGEDLYRSKLTTHYEEYEQYPSSPWAQSPAPSPAIQADPNENPFFAGANVDEDSFNPTGTGPDYSQYGPVEAIGIDRASTVTHLPLIHPILSQVMQPFDSDSPARTPAESFSSRPDMSATSSDHPSFQRKAPIAILSVLSSAVPYPQNLTQALKLLAPHLATSFANSLHYTNAQRQASGLRHRRFGSNPNVGFAPTAADTESLEDLMRLDIDQITDSATGSITSPSEYSSRSTGGSIAGTPGWDPSALGFTSKHSVGSTPGHEVVDSYFDAKKKTGASRSSSAAAINRQPEGSREPSGEQRAGRKVVTIMPTEEDDATPKLDIPSTSRPAAKEGKHSGPHARQGSPSRATPPRRFSLRLNHPQHGDGGHNRSHSYLHSYGADFSSSFQSLPAATTPLRTPAPTSHGRSNSLSERTDMPPPSERLLRTIIDSLPVQVFTAAPATGALTWVNTKFLVYRGQDSRQVLQEPWDAIHPEDREEYMSFWNKSLRTGQQFQQKARVQRFDGHYRWFYVRAAPLKDKRQNIVHWIGTNMDVHDQHLAEINAARQQETAASEAKYRALANSSPQIVFAVTQSRGITFCNGQWLSYTGQTEEEALGLGFMDFVHPEDLVKCRLPAFDNDGNIPKNVPLSMPSDLTRSTSIADSSSSDETATNKTVTSPGGETEPSAIHMPQTRLSKLADTGILKVTKDADGRPSYSTEVRLRSKDGVYHWHLVRILLAEPVLSEAQEETWYGTCTDINDHKLLEQTLKETMDAKSRFLSNMSHEIRTPLNGITGMVNFLIDSNLTAEQMEHVNIIRSSTEGLRDLINDILDLSKVEAGMITLAMDWLHVRSLIEEVNDLTSAMAINKGLELNYIVEEDVPSMVKGDRFRIRQVLLNVIGNAIKFTQKGEVFVRCRIAEDQEDSMESKESLVQFDVIDTGSGFTEKEAEYLFKRFSQIDGSSTRQHGGTGLGLAISMQLVELHGGKMKASSVPGKGSTFTFTIKFTLPSEKERPPQDSASHGFSIVSAHSTLSPALSETNKPSAPAIPSPKDSTKSPSSVSSSASSDPSVRTNRTSLPSTRSSASSFTSDANASGMKLTLPLDVSNKRTESDESVAESNTSVDTAKPSIAVSQTRTPSPLSQPPMYSILVACPLPYSREATVKHIEMTLPKTIPAQITARESVEEAQKMISGDDPVIFTHVVLVLHETKEVLSFIDQIFRSQAHSGTSVVIISDLVQKREIMGEAAEHNYEKLSKERRLRFIFKPLKPSKFAVIFDPQKQREISTDRNENSAQQVAVNQKMVFDAMKRRLGNKGHRVLLVEDNKINQTVLLKLLGKVAINVETVLDGVECTDRVFSKGHQYYSIILCDLHMPNKDGYQTCKEIRKWEKKNKYPHLPIIALSANVLGDVYMKCVEAGFNSYVTKPVDFKELSAVMTRFLDPPDPLQPHEFMRPRKG